MYKFIPKHDLECAINMITASLGLSFICAPTIFWGVNEPWTSEHTYIQSRKFEPTEYTKIAHISEINANICPVLAQSANINT